MSAFFKGFAYAARGVFGAIKRERNLRFHLCMAVYVVLFSLFFKLTNAQYALLAIVIALVIALELINTAIENIVDKLSPQKNAVAGYIKDVSAGAVLVFCVAAVVCAFLFFWDLQGWVTIRVWFTNRPLMLALLAASFVVSTWFVLFFGQKKGKI